MSEQPDHSFRENLHRKTASYRNSADDRDEFLKIAADGKKRTSREIREMLGMPTDKKVTSFLRGLKYCLCVERTGIRLRVEAGKVNNELVWWVERKRKI